MAARRKAFALMTEALEVLDNAPIELIVGARLQAAIDTLGLDPSGHSCEHLGDLQTDQILDQLLSASSSQLPGIIDALGIPGYITDADGRVTYWNTECVAFAGRRPERGSDQWCVTWKLYTTDGKPLPHERCPMAIAIKEQRPIRDEVAIAARPSGKRVAFRPYPTPLFDEQGNLIGAVNILVDVSKEQSSELRHQARVCRQIAKSTEDTRALAILADLANAYEATAASIS